MNEVGGLTPGQPGTTAQTSLIISDLSARRSVLPSSGPYAQVAQAVLEASKGSAQADLRVARLTARAKSKNWLPQIGPSLSLTSLGDLATQLVLEQVLFDNGAKKAEREYAAADVEVAAVTLSAEMNDTVHDGLSYYVSALKARDQAAVDTRAAARLGEYDRIMRERVKGGLSDMSEARVLAQKLSEMQALTAADKDAAATAMAQLQAMTARDLSGLSGLSEFDLPTPAPDPLSVKQAEGEKARTIAEAKMARAGHLPGLSASASAGSGKPNLGLSLGTSQLLGIGTADTLAALDATQDAAGARVETARQAADQRLAALGAKLRAAQAKEARDADVVAQTDAGLKMFTEQYRMGRRTLMELVTAYENFAAMERAQVGLKYDIALIKLEMAREHGILVNGSSI
jgi:adhesin transport system outer membrane protein